MAKHVKLAIFYYVYSFISRIYYFSKRLRSESNAKYPATAADHVVTHNRPKQSPTSTSEEGTSVAVNYIVNGFTGFTCG